MKHVPLIPTHCRPEGNSQTNGSSKREDQEGRIQAQRGRGGVGKEKGEEGRRGYGNRKGTKQGRRRGGGKGREGFPT